MRPFVLRVARREGLVGEVWNDLRGVEIRVAGSEDAVGRFREALRSEAPALARIDGFEIEEAPVAARKDFIITESDGAGIARVALTTDAATCEACLRELRDPTDRRYGYPLINCTECGPRFSLVTGVPYDRRNTTMANFPLCAECREEYEDPTNRRYHAQPVCCPACGPALRAQFANARVAEASAAMKALRDVLAGDGVALIQGLGGFHLAGRMNEASATRLRRIKRRDAKPFAIMVRDLERAHRWVELEGADAAALASPRRPILLAPRRPEVETEAAWVAPGTHLLGVMLPYTPIHHLLFDDPRLRDEALVMTSANLSHAPMIYGGEDLERFPREDVDLVVDHGRAIARRLDDPIFRSAPRPRPIRRGRGYAPEPIAIPDMPELLAVGGDLKNAFCLGRDGEALLSAHHGDLSHPAARSNFEAETERWLKFFEVRPRGVACDLHPDFASTRSAERWAARLGVPLLRVQHHHAHAASLLAEHGVSSPTLAIVLDGYGYGDDRQPWGGELLLATTGGYRRLACIAPVAAFGGDRYALEPSRPALAWLARAGALDHPVVQQLEPDPGRRSALIRMVTASPSISTSAGRLFDAVGALLGLSRQNRFEAETAMALEAAAARGQVCSAAPAIRIVEASELRWLDPSELLLWIATQGAQTPLDAAATFHARLATAFAQLLVRARGELSEIETAGLSGGVAVNETFAARLRQEVQDTSLRWLEHERVPPNDGGLALGQAAVLAHALRG